MLWLRHGTVWMWDFCSWVYNLSSLENKISLILEDKMVFCYCFLLLLITGEGSEQYLENRLERGCSFTASV